MGFSRREYTVRCHCGVVKGKFVASEDKLVAWNCNCSDCAMRGNIHVVVPQDDFRLDLESNYKLEDVTILYEWGTKTAKRRFCRFCGILPWYRPRSNPDGYGITLKCIDMEGGNKPHIEIKTFDGQNWEEYFSKSDISAQSKKN